MVLLTPKAFMFFLGRINKMALLTGWVALKDSTCAPVFAEGQELDPSLINCQR